MKGDKAICAYEPCSKEFTKAKEGQKYHCKTCGKKDRYEKNREHFLELMRGYNKTHKNEILRGETNPNPITQMTVYMTIQAIEKGESIESIARETKRNPEDLKKVIAYMKHTNRYDRIVKFLKTRNEKGNTGELPYFSWTGYHQG
jgi:hypothetical protein